MCGRGQVERLPSSIDPEDLPYLPLTSSARTPSISGDVVDGTSVTAAAVGETVVEEAVRRLAAAYVCSY